jgi:hypothetical protein
MRIPKPKEILKLLKNNSHRPMRTKELSRRLGVPKEGRLLLKKVLGKMVTEGKIGRTKGGYMYSAPKETAEVKKKARKGERPHRGMVKAAGSSGSSSGREHRKDNTEGRQDAASTSRPAR